MSENNNQPIYAIKNEDTYTLQTLDKCSPWPNADASFVICNFDYEEYHTHNFWEIILLTHGKINNYIGDEFKTLSVGDACLVKPHEKHKLICPTENDLQHLQQITFYLTDSYVKKFCHLYSDDLYEDLLSDKRPFYFNVGQNKTMQILGSCIFIQHQNEKLKNNKKVFFTKSIVNNFLTSVISEIKPLNSKYPQWFQDLLVTLSHPKEYNFQSVEALASKTPYSYSRLSRYFKEFTGVTINKYITEQKLTLAKDLIANTETKIANVSSELGFTSVSHLNHIFLKKYGVSPSEFRRLNGHVKIE